MQPTPPPRPRATAPPAAIFPAPALRRGPLPAPTRPPAPTATARVEARVTGSFSLGRGPWAFEVELALFGGAVVCRTVVRARRVCFGFVRGSSTVEILDRGLDAEAHRAAIEAAARSAAAGSRA